MARIRTIKPEFWVDDAMVELPFETRLLFIGLWNFVDDEGYIEDKPKRIKMQIFPADNVLIEDSLSALCNSGRLHAFDSDQGPVLRVANWERHQRISRPTGTRFTGIMPRNRDHSVSPHGALAESSRGKGKEGKGRERKGVSATHSLALDVFEKAWQFWPKKTEKKQALERFLKAATKFEDPTDLGRHVVAFGTAYAETTETRFVPGLGVWLNGERWTDTLPTRGSTPRTKADENAAEFRRLYGGNDERAGSVPALDVR